MMAITAFILLSSMVYAADLNLTCNLNLCPSSVRGDNYCDKRCMFPYCNYDSNSLSDPKAQMLSSDCTWQCLYINACSSSHLGNGVCDSDCNIIECGFDLGDCGFCASGCYEFMLGGSCDEACNVTSCYYDLGACQNCADNCTADMMGNGVCDPECDNNNCNYDFGDCQTEACAPKCYTYMIGDSICQDACHVPECNYDYFDCDCYPGCTSELLSNKECDSVCNTKRCNYDNHDCGDCASGCFTKMLGNLECNDECNNNDCNFDYGDCGCATGCSLSDYGQCKYECMVGSCAYDQASSDPGKRCQDYNLVMFDLRQNLIWESFDFQPDFSWCYQDNDYCDIEYSYNNCDENCESKSCLYSWINCDYEKSLDCYQNGCSLCYGSGYGECFQCKEEGYFQFYGYCSLMCEYGYEPKRIMGSNPVCLPLIDNTTPENPKVFYATSVISGDSQGGDGTWETPFETFSTALAKIQTKYSILYLINDGDYEWALVDHIYIVSGWVKDQTKPLNHGNSYDTGVLKYLKIASLDGSIVKIKTISDKWNIHIGIWAGLTLEVENVILDGYETDFSCKGIEYCDYCPYVEKQIDNSYLNDRGEEISTDDFLPSSYCTYSKSSNLFGVYYGATLTLTNVTFTNWRTGYFALIESLGGEINLVNVNFDNIFIYSNEISAVISIHDCTDSSYNCGYLNYTNGKVTRINNGYEYDDPVDFRGFIYADRIEYVILRNISFENNFISIQTSSTLTSASLITMKVFRFLEIDNCSFNLNIADTGIVNIVSKGLSFMTYVNSDKELIDLTIDHVHIHDSNFTNNYGKSYGILYASFKGELQNIRLQNLNISGNGVKDGPLIEIMNNEIKQEYLNDTKKPVALPSGQRVTAVYKARWFILREINFTNNYQGGKGIIDANNMVNLDMNNILVDSNGAASSKNITVNSIILSKWIDNPDMYIKLESSQAEIIDCESIMEFAGLVNSSLSNISLINNYCESSSPSLIISKVKTFFISSLNCTGNQGSGEYALCIYVDGNIQLNISDSVFINNINHLSSGMGAIGTAIAVSSMSIKNCQFKSNSAGYGGALLFQGQYLSLYNLIFEANISPTQFGGAIFFSPQLILSSSGFYIKNCNFTKNTALSSGGAIYFEEANLGSTVIDIQMENCTFDSNKAKSGAAVFIEKTAALTQSSTVSKSYFWNNEASQLGVFSDLHYYGILTIADCEFSKNSAKLGAAIYINTNEDTASLRSQTKVASCVISHSSGDSMVCMDDLSQYSYLETANCIFDSNSGTAVALNYDHWIDSGSVFKYNSAFKTGGSVNLQNQALAESKNAIFHNSTNQGTGGAVTISSQSVFKCDYCNFTNNYAGNSGGVFFVEQNSYFNVSNSIITQNSCIKKGSVMYLLGTSYAPSIISSTDIYANKANGEGSIVLLDASIAIYSSKIHENSAQVTSAGILLTLSNANISDTQMHSQSGKQGCFVYASTQSYIAINNSEFMDGTASGSGGAIFSIASIITINNCHFMNIYSNSEGAIQAYSDTVLVINGSSFWNTTSETSGGIVGSSQSTISIQYSNFDMFSHTGIYGEKLISLEIIGSRFDDGVGVYGGSVYCSMCEAISIKNSEFSNFKAQIGGALYLVTQSDTAIKYQYVISNCKFYSNSASNGGAIYTNNIKLLVENSEIRNNSAIASTSTEIDGNVQYGNGGGLCLNCKDFYNCVFNLTNISFIANIASYNGGAYSWNDIKPVSSGNTFENNSAAYASDVSSYPVSMASVDSKESAQKLRRLENSPVVATLDGIASGQICKTPLSIALIDHDNNVVKTDNSSQAELEAVDEETTISGITKVSAEEGVFNFKQFIVTGTPGNETQIKVYTSAIDPSRGSKAQDGAVYNQEIYVNVTFRLCELGEATIGNVCKVCEGGTYSLNPKNPICSTCPDGAICLGNYTMVPKSGYWRDNEYTDKFWKCRNSNACSGSPISKQNISYTGKCADGYKGNLCQSCEYGYSKSSSETCSPCPSPAVNSIRIIGVFLALTILDLIMVKSTRESAFKPKSLTSVYIKIFLNYLQLVMLVTTFNLNWPSLVWQVFSAQNNTGSVSDQIFSFDCFLQTSSDDPDQFYFNKLILMSLMPIGIALLALLIWLAIDFKRKNFEHFTNDYISTCIILLFIVHPNIVKMMFGSFNCQQINSGEYWLSEDLDIRCWGRRHLFYIFVVSIPSVIVWGIGIPAVCWLNLMKNRRKLDNLSVRLKFGFFFNGYTGNCYYWEFIILYRKILVICCSVFLANVSISIQALTVTIVLISCLHLQYTFRPYNGIDLNRMELRSILVSAVTIYCGLYFLTDDLNSGSSYFFFIVIVFVNLYFLYFWLSKLLHAGLVMASEKLPWLRRMLGLSDDGFEDNIFHQKKKGHVFSKDGEKFFSLLHEMKEKNDVPEPFDSKLTMADMFISVIPELEEGKILQHGENSDLKTSMVSSVRDSPTTLTLQEFDKEGSEERFIEERSIDDKDIQLEISDAAEDVYVPYRNYSKKSK